MDMMRVIDPEGVEYRKTRQLRRRIYRSKVIVWTQCMTLPVFYIIQLYCYRDPISAGT